MIDTTSRRAVLASFTGALCVPAIAAVPMRGPAPNPLDVARHSADLLAAMLTEAHGVAWAATVGGGFVLIQPEGGAR